MTRIAAMSHDLKHAILRYSGQQGRAEGVTVTPVRGLHLVRHTAPSELEHTLAHPLVCLVLQGCKRVTTGRGVSSYAAGSTMIVTSSRPEATRVNKASFAVPYLAVALDLDPTVITDLVTRAPELHSSRAAPETSEELRDAFRRLVLLLDRPQPLAMLKDGLIREIHYWLLLGRQGTAIRNLGLPDSHAQRIARAVAMLRADHARPVQIERLASAAGMSRSAFHQHFRAITSLSPLQFQKHLRLIEARRLILEGKTLSQVAFKVGYVSPSQFSREYTRMFGQPPSVDKKAASGRWGKDDASEPAAARFV